MASSIKTPQHPDSKEREIVRLSIEGSEISIAEREAISEYLARTRPERAVKGRRRQLRGLATKKAGVRKTSR
ncbi:MAG TPA: hypothetical protein VIC04_04475 [Terriglobia bacterium]|jgi:hypothetical protein